MYNPKRGREVIIVETNVLLSQLNLCYVSMTEVEIAIQSMLLVI